MPRSQARSGSPGTCASTSMSGSEIVSATISAATAARRRCPCSFQDRTNDFAPPSYTTAARARANASRRPEHSTQRRTGHAPGEPQRSQIGRAQADEGVTTVLAERGAGSPTDRTALREEQLEHIVIVGGYRLRLCEKMRSASWSVSASRCRTTVRAGARCRPTCADRATRSDDPAGPGCCPPPDTGE